MSYVLHEQRSKQIYTCWLTNTYNLMYYGTKFWESAEDALNDVSTIFEGVDQSEEADWSPLEITETQLKMMNVKLRNDAANRLLWNDGSISVISV